MNLNPIIELEMDLMNPLDSPSDQFCRPAKIDLRSIEQIKMVSFFSSMKPCQTVREFLMNAGLLTIKKRT